MMNPVGGYDLAAGGEHGHILSKCHCAMHTSQEQEENHVALTAIRTRSQHMLGTDSECPCRAQGHTLDTLWEEAYRASLSFL